jgi:CTP:molybdopterin cytidylyltransferase MocA
MEKEIGEYPLILLAGGRSSRMGTPKGLLDYHGHPWLIEQLQRFKASYGKRVIIVLGYHQAPYFEQIPWLVKAVTEPVQQLGLEISVVINPAPEHGQFSSLQQAVAFLHANETDFTERPCPSQAPNAERSFIGQKIPGAFILPIDVPCPGKEVFQELAEAFSPSIDAAIPQYQSKGGHPVLLGGDFLSRLAEVPPASPLARLDLQILSLPKDWIALVSVNDKSICLNMNSMIEFQKYAQTDRESFQT